MARFMSCDGCKAKLVCELCDDKWLCWICRYERDKDVDDLIGKTITLEPIESEVRTSSPTA